MPKDSLGGEIKRRKMTPEDKKGSKKLTQDLQSPVLCRS